MKRGGGAACCALLGDPKDKIRGICYQGVTSKSRVNFKISTGEKCLMIYILFLFSPVNAVPFSPIHRHGDRGKKEEYIYHQTFFPC